MMSISKKKCDETEISTPESSSNRDTIGKNRSEEVHREGILGNEQRHRRNTSYSRYLGLGSFSNKLTIENQYTPPPEDGYDRRSSSAPAPDINEERPDIRNSIQKLEKKFNPGWLAPRSSKASEKMDQVAREQLDHKVDGGMPPRPTRHKSRTAEDRAGRAPPAFDPHSGGRGRTRAAAAAAAAFPPAGLREAAVARQLRAEARDFERLGPPPPSAVIETLDLEKEMFAAPLSKKKKSSRPSEKKKSKKLSSNKKQGSSKEPIKVKKQTMTKSKTASTSKKVLRKKTRPEEDPALLQLSSVLPIPASFPGDGDGGGDTGVPPPPPPLGEGTAATTATEDAALAAAERAAERWRSSADGVGRRHLRELKAMKHPPASVKILAKALCLIFGIRPHKKSHISSAGRVEITDYWSPCQKLLSRPSQFLEKIHSFDISTLSSSAVEALGVIVRNDNFSTDSLKKVSAAAAPLGAWVRAVEAEGRRRRRARGSGPAAAQERSTTKEMEEASLQSSGSESGPESVSSKSLSNSEITENSRPGSTNSYDSNSSGEVVEQDYRNSTKEVAKYAGENIVSMQQQQQSTSVMKKFASKVSKKFKGVFMAKTEASNAHALEELPYSESDSEPEYEQQSIVHHEKPTKAAVNPKHLLEMLERDPSLMDVVAEAIAAQTQQQQQPPPHQQRRQQQSAAPPFRGGLLQQRRAMVDALEAEQLQFEMYREPQAALAPLVEYDDGAPSSGPAAAAERDSDDVRRKQRGLQVEMLSELARTQPLDLSSRMQRLRMARREPGATPYAQELRKIQEEEDMFRLMQESLDRGLAGALLGGEQGGGRGGGGGGGLLPAATAAAPRTAVRVKAEEVIDLTADDEEIKPNETLRNKPENMPPRPPTLKEQKEAENMYDINMEISQDGSQQVLGQGSNPAIQGTIHDNPEVPAADFIEKVREAKELSHEDFTPEWRSVLGKDGQKYYINPAELAKMHLKSKEREELVYQDNSSSEVGHQESHQIPPIVLGVGPHTSAKELHNAKFIKDKAMQELRSMTQKITNSKYSKAKKEYDARNSIAAFQLLKQQLEGISSLSEAQVTGRQKLKVLQLGTDSQSFTQTLQQDEDAARMIQRWYRYHQIKPKFKLHDEESQEQGYGAFAADSSTMLSSSKHLFAAASVGSLAEIERLAAVGADVNRGDPARQGRTPLHEAAGVGRVPHAALLLDLGANINVQDIRGTTPLDEAVRVGNLAIVKLLMERGADVRRTRLGIGGILTREGLEGLLERDLVLPRHADPPARRAIARLLASGPTLVAGCRLVAAAAGGDLDAVKELLAKHGGEADVVNHRTAEGSTALHQACAGGHVACAELLLEAGADPAARDADGQTPAARLADAPPQALPAEEAGPASRTAGGQAAPRKRDPGGAGRRRGPGRRRHDWPAAEDPGGGRARLTALLAETSGMGRDFLEDVKNNLLSKVQARLELGADVNYAAPYSRRTALLVACQNEFLEVATLLLDKGADIAAVTRTGQSALHLAIENLEITRRLVTRGAPVNLEDESGRTPLHWAVASGSGSEAVARLLLGAGANPLARDIRDQTSLHVAAQDGADVGILGLLLEEVTLLEDEQDRKAALEAVDIDGRSPLFLACWQGHVAQATLLLQWGASGDLAEDRHGKHPLDYGNAPLEAAEKLRSLLQPSSVAQLGRDGLLLSYACRGDLDGIEQLCLSEKDSVQEAGGVADARGATAAHLAAARGRPSVLARLLAPPCAAPLDALDRNGEPPGKTFCSEVDPETRVKIIQIIREGAAQDPKRYSKFMHHWPLQLELRPPDDTEESLVQQPSKRKDSLLAPPELPDLASTSRNVSGGYKVIDSNELTVEGVIGEGSFGIVRKAQWRGMEVAVKELKLTTFTQGVDLHALEQEDLRHEAELLARVCNHSCVVQFVGVTWRPLALVTRYMRNGSVEDLLVGTDEGVRPPLVVRMALEAAAGVAHLHAEGIIHRDLAARNLLIDEYMHVRVADFGFARVKESYLSRGYTASDVGPIRWTAPEAMRRKEYSERSDVFSFGVVLWEMSARAVPWGGLENLDVAFRVCSGERLIPPGSGNGELDPAITELMHCCWSHDPTSRPSMQSIIETLGALVNNDDSTHSLQDMEQFGLAHMLQDAALSNNHTYSNVTLPSAADENSSIIEEHGATTKSHSIQGEEEEFHSAVPYDLPTSSREVDQSSKDLDQHTYGKTKF